jgi:hypothetical protein
MGTRSTTILDPEKHTAEETFTDSAGKVLKKTVFTVNERNFSTSAIITTRGAMSATKRFTHWTEAIGSVKRSSLPRTIGHSANAFSITTNEAKAYIEDYDAKGTLIPAPAPVKPGRPDKKKR